MLILVMAFATSSTSDWAGGSPKLPRETCFLWPLSWPERLLQRLCPWAPHLGVVKSGLSFRLVLVSITLEPHSAGPAGARGQPDRGRDLLEVRRRAWKLCLETSSVSRTVMPLRWSYVFLSKTEQIWLQRGKFPPFCVIFSNPVYT